MPRNKITIFIFLMVILSGCSLISPVKTGPDTKYVINCVPEPVIKRPYRQITLFVSQTQSDPIYATKQMAYTTQAYRVAYYIHNHWASNPAQMIQRVITETLQNTHYFHAVDTSSANIHYDYILNTRLLELCQIIKCGQSIIKLTVYMELINANTNKIVIAKQFTIIEPIFQISPCGEALAANEAAAKLALIITRYSLKYAY